jgi:hypothetical protein
MVSATLMLRPRTLVYYVYFNNNYLSNSSLKILKAFITFITVMILYLNNTYSIQTNYNFFT